MPAPISFAGSALDPSKVLAPSFNASLSSSIQSPAGPIERGPHVGTVEVARRPCDARADVPEARAHHRAAAPAGRGRAIRVPPKPDVDPDRAPEARRLGALSAAHRLRRRRSLARRPVVQGRDGRPCTRLRQLLRSMDRRGDHPKLARLLRRYAQYSRCADQPPGARKSRASAVAGTDRPRPERAVGLPTRRSANATGCETLPQFVDTKPKCGVGGFRWRRQ